MSRFTRQFIWVFLEIIIIESIFPSLEGCDSRVITSKWEGDSLSSSCGKDSEKIEDANTSTV